MDANCALRQSKSILMITKVEETDSEESELNIK